MPMDGPGSWRCAAGGISTRSERDWVVNGPLTPALPGRRIALRERALKADCGAADVGDRLPLPQGDTAAREGWGEGTIHHKSLKPRPPPLYTSFTLP